MRHAPDIELPERPFLPGSGADRPEIDRPPAAPLSLESWRDHRGLAFGVDLWDRGFYWEAHEVWEDAWQLTPEGPERELLRGLIQLAAARVQSALGSDGASTLAARAAEHLRAAAIRPIVGGVWIDDVITSGELRWRRRTRDLPGAWTDLHVQPLECAFARGDGAIVQRTPDYSGYYGGRAYYVDAFDRERSRAAATAALGDDGPGFLNLIWEVEEPGPPDFETREGDELDHFVVLSTDELALEPAPPAGVEVRPLRDDRDWARATAFAGRVAVIDWGEGARSFTDWRYQRFRATVELHGGDFFAAFDGDEAVGCLGIVDCGRVFRYQDVQVAPSYRRRGIARYLCARAFLDAGARTGKPAVIVADHGSIAHRLYGQLGFERVSTQHYLRWTHPG